MDKRCVCESIRAGEPTKSGRIYPKDILIEAIEKYKKGYMIGTLAPKSTTAVNLTEVTHQIKNVWLNDEGQIECDIQILKTPLGLMLNGTEDKLSVNALGSVDENGIVNDMEIVSIDLLGE